MSLEKRYTRLLCATVMLLCIDTSVLAQQKNIPLNRYYTQEVERYLLQDSVAFVHAGAKPFLESQLNLKNNFLFDIDSTKNYKFVGRRIFQSHFLEIKKDDYFLALDPLFDFTVGKDLSDNSSYGEQFLFTNQRGAQLIGDIGKKFSFQTSFYETQAFVPGYFKEICNEYGVFPGFGRTKAFGKTGFDFGMSNGWVSYTPAKNLNIQFGQGKNFYGHGYRSLLWSDAAFSYPFLKATFSFFNNKLQYSTMYASLQTLDRLPKGEVPESLFKRKGASVNYLSWIPVRGLEIGFFESIIWEKYSDSSGTKPQPYGTFIPVIGVNSAIQGLGSVNNTMVGMNIKVKTSRHSFVYGQIALDDTSPQAYGFQIGGKYFDLLLKNLDIQFELNTLSSNIYASHYPIQSDTHFNQPLGHPAGPSTNEVLGILNYRFRRYIVQVKYNTIRHTTGPLGSWATDPKASSESFAAWPIKQTTQLDFNTGFVFNPKTNFQILFGYLKRTDTTDYSLIEDEVKFTNYFYVSLRTNLINRYADF